MYANRFAGAQQDILRGRKRSRRVPGRPDPGTPVPCPVSNFIIDDQSSKIKPSSLRGMHQVFIGRAVFTETERRSIVSLGIITHFCPTNDKPAYEDFTLMAFPASIL